MEAGIGTILKAPIGGALLSAEILYRRDAEWRVLYPALVASATAYALYSVVMGPGPILGVHDVSVGIYELPLFIPLGLLDGLAARLYVYVFHRLGRWFRELRVKRYVKPLMGGLAVGAMGLIAPEVLGEGLGWVRVELNGGTGSFVVLGARAEGIALLALLAALPLIKILATSLTIDSGPAGGVFVPGLVIGAFLGFDYGLLLHLLDPGIATSTVPFTMASMLALFGPASGAPLAVMVMVLEMTGDYQAVLGALVALATSYAIVGGRGIFTSQPLNRSTPTQVD